MRFVLFLLAMTALGVQPANAVVGMYSFTLSGTLTGTQHSVDCVLGGPTNCITAQTVAVPFQTVINLPVSAFADGSELFDYGNPRASVGEYRGTITALDDGTFSGTGLGFWLTTVPIGCGTTCRGIDEYLSADTFTVQEAGAVSTQSASFAVPDTSPVPEPATWIMVLLGFGFIGMAMRRGLFRQQATMVPAL